MRNSLLLGAALLAGSVAFAADEASATPYTFTSTGSFSNLNGATSLSSSEIGWGGSTTRNGGYTGSMLTAVELKLQSGNTPAIGDLVGQLVWYNASTSVDTTQTTVTADYTLKLDFSKPLPGGTASETLDLTITNTANTTRVCFLGVCWNQDANVPDTISIPSLSSITVDGLVLSNFKFQLASCDPGSLAGGIWSDPEGEATTLNIYANIANVPEPASMVLLGVGMIGTGALARRRRSSALPLAAC